MMNLGLAESKRWSYSLNPRRSAPYIFKMIANSLFVKLLLSEREIVACQKVSCNSGFMFLFDIAFFVAKFNLVFIILKWF